MRQFGLILFSVVIGILASVIVDAVVSSCFSGLRGGSAAHWIGNVVSIVVALVIFNIVSRRRTF